MIAYCLVIRQAKYPGIQWPSYSPATCPASRLIQLMSTDHPITPEKHLLLQEYLFSAFHHITLHSLLCTFYMVGYLTRGTGREK